MSKSYKIFLLFLAILLGYFLYYSGRVLIIQFKGSQITANVAKVPTYCGHLNTIQVLYEGKTYPVNISKQDCLERRYKVGLNVTLIKYKNDDELIWPESNFVLLPFVFLTVVGLMWYTNKDKFIMEMKRS